MAQITDYTTLQAEIVSWLDREDLTDKIPGFIQLAEAKIRRLVRRQTLRASLVISAYENALTQVANFGELRSIHLVTSDGAMDAPLRIGSPEQLAEFRQSSVTAGRPGYACVVGTNLLVGPTPDQSYDAEVTYFEGLQALSDTNTSNSILLEAPDLYLWGALLMATPYLEHDERIPTWRDQFKEAIAELDASRDREEFGASFRPIRLPVVYG